MAINKFYFGRKRKFLNWFFILETQNKDSLRMERVRLLPVQVKTGVSPIVQFSPLR
uniref:Uncharacterized protein n=1 Tax=Anguilla anguilla TaxID=7936 RepID=A0A0E9QK99_ANGAN